MRREFNANYLQTTSNVFSKWCLNNTKQTAKRRAMRGLWSQPRVPWLRWPHDLLDPDVSVIDSNGSFCSSKLSFDYSEQVSMGITYDRDIDSVDSKMKISCGQPIHRLCAGVLRKSSLQMLISIIRKNVLNQ